MPGCGKSQPKQPCKHQAHVEIKRVDENTKLANKLYAHVGAGREGHATDPAAVTAGITADIDQWTWDEKTPDGLPTGDRHLLDFYIRGPSRAVVEHYLGELATQDPAFAIAADHQLGFEHITRSGKSDWRTYDLRAAPLLGEHDIAEAKPGTDPSTGRPLVTVELTAAGKQRFAEVTRANAGHKLAFIVDGDISAAPIIVGQITGGTFTLFADGPGEAAALAAKLTCPGS